MSILRVCDIYADDNLKEDREFIKIDFIPAILKHQIGRIRRASKANKKEMIKLFRAELLELKKRNMLGFRGHKLINWLTYQWLLYGKNCNFYFLISKLLNFLPIKKNTIFISNFGGRPYGCNPKYIVEEIFRRNLNYNIYWTVEKKDKKTKSMFPPMIRLVRKKSLLELYLFSRANIIISNVTIGLGASWNLHFIYEWRIDDFLPLRYHILTFLTRPVLPTVPVFLKEAFYDPQSTAAFYVWPLRQ